MKVKVDIDEMGNMNVEVMGAQGKGCLNATNGLLAGHKVTSKKMKPEFFVEKKQVKTQKLGW